MAPGWEEKIKVRAAPFIFRAARDIADDARQSIRAQTYDTGALYRSVRARRNTVMMGTRHWRFIEFGTRRHTIRARRKKVLASATKIFGPSVNHPGNRPYAHLRRAAYKRRRLRRF